MSDERLYWIWLSEKLGAGNQKFGRLLEGGLTAKEIHAMDAPALKEFLPAGRADQKVLMDKDLTAAKGILKKCEELGMKILTPEDEGFPQRLLNIYAPPYILYVWGELPLIDNFVVISFVGSRKASDYGRWAVQRLAYDVTTAGALVVSGMAVGVDAAAHKGALKAGGKTVGVLGCGLDVGYPAANRDLMRFAIKNGALISEYPPGTMPLPGNFPIRNRIISALSNGVVIADAPKKSGALITAGYAEEQGRDIFAVPSNIHLPVGEGSNNLLKDRAKPVTCAYDILEEYENLYRDKLTIKEEYKKRLVPRPQGGGGREKEPKAPAGDTPAKKAPAEIAPPAAKKEGVPETPERAIDLLALSKNERAIAETVRSGAAVTPDALIETLGLTAQQVNASVTMLELKGILEKTGEKTLKFTV